MANNRGSKLAVKEAVLAYWETNPSATWPQVHAAVPNHYANPDTMRGALGPRTLLLDEGRIKNAPRGVLTDTRQQQRVAKDGRGIAQGSPDAILAEPQTDVFGQPWAISDSSMRGAASAIHVGYDLQSRILDYEAMDDYPECSTVLNIYADDSTIQDEEKDHCIWATGDDELVRSIVDDLLYRRLNVDGDAWSTIRTMCKYGNAVAEIVADKNGVQGLNYLPAASVRKVLDYRGTVMGYVQSVSMDFAGIDWKRFEKLLKDRNINKGPDKDGFVAFAPWEIVWWQMPSRHVRSPYGVSILDPARWAWKRLSMLEDTSVAYLLTRPPSRNVIYVDTQDIPPNMAMAHMQNVKQQWKKTRTVDPNTGQLDLRFNALSNDEDVFIPTRGGREASRIETLQGPEYNIIDQLEFFREKLFAALRVPKSYLSMADETTRANLSQQDVMFGRSTMRIQRMYMTGLMQVCRLHLALLDVDPDVYSFGLDMTVPSSILEMAQIEVANSRAALAAGYTDFYDKRSILVRVFGESEASADAIVRNKQHEEVEDAKVKGEAEYAMSQGMQPGGSGSDPTAMPEEPAAETPSEEAPVSSEEWSNIEQRLTSLVERLDRNDKVAQLEKRRERSLEKDLREISKGMRSIKRVTQQTSEDVRSLPLRRRG